MSRCAPLNRSNSIWQQVKIALRILSLSAIIIPVNKSLSPLTALFSLQRSAIQLLVLAAIVHCLTMVAIVNMTVCVGIRVTSIIITRCHKTVNHRSWRAFRFDFFKENRKTNTKHKNILKPLDIVTNI